MKENPTSDAGSIVQIVRSIADWRLLRTELGGNRSIGFVPTMGALHAGHGSLMKRCRAENPISVLSIFVNPTQFDDQSDLARYPVSEEKDLTMARTCGVDYVLIPSGQEIYPDGYHYRVTENIESRTLCGAHRPAHFDGVLTVVLKLLLLVQPKKVYFGEKDYQQLRLVSGMCQAFFIDTEVVGCPIVRDADGLAMSSRNSRLDPEARRMAARFPQMLRQAADCTAVRHNLEALGFTIDYVEDRDGRRFGAVRIGGVRLIDNVSLGEVHGRD